MTKRKRPIPEPTQTLSSTKRVTRRSVGTADSSGKDKSSIAEANGAQRSPELVKQLSTSKLRHCSNSDEKSVEALVSGETTQVAQIGALNDAEAATHGEDGGGVDIVEFEQAVSRTPPVNSSYLPLPWRGRLGYACLNTYLRAANPSVFSSRTCRIASILEHRHPLTDPSAPYHPTKNRPDLQKPPDVILGQRYVESFGLANAKDIVKMLRWNDKYGIKFFRLSSEMFPFASHAEYGYKLTPFAAQALGEAGKVAAELGHRLTTHPGQFSQLGSPNESVIAASIRDLEFHSELLSLLKLPPQQDRDAVMILHMGGAYGDKAGALNRFRKNYARLSRDIQNRLVLENDDVVWTVHDLLPICEELNIPLVLDFHHHNILFDASQLREGTEDIRQLFPRIRATWDRKRITQKMHYSEPCPDAITPRQRRRHSPRVATLPPCAPDMDLMIEAKDKEQAVFELMRAFRLPGFDSFNDMIPHVRQDENRPPKKRLKTKQATSKADEPLGVSDEDFAMGGPQNRVYWPPGMESWLRPAPRAANKKHKSGTNNAIDNVNGVTVEVNPRYGNSLPASTRQQIDATPRASRPRGIKEQRSKRRRTATTAMTPPSSVVEDVWSEGTTDEANVPTILAPTSLRGRRNRPKK